MFLGIWQLLGLKTFWSVPGWLLYFSRYFVMSRALVLGLFITILIVSLGKVVWLPWSVFTFCGICVTVMFNNSLNSRTTNSICFCYLSVPFSPTSQFYNLLTNIFDVLYILWHYTGKEIKKFTWLMKIVENFKMIWSRTKNSHITIVYLKIEDFGT